MIKYGKKILCVILLFCLVLQISCGKTETSRDSSDTQGNPAGSDTNRTQEDPIGNDISQMPAETEDDGIVMLRGDRPTRAGAVEQTWVKDYDSTEWENSPCLYLYVRLPEADNTTFSVTEEELNHRLYLAGYDFHIQFLYCSFEEVYDPEQTTDMLVERKEEELGISVDLYLTRNYPSAVQNEELLELTDYVEEQRELYEHYDESVWAQLRDGEGRIYGIPTNPIAAAKLGYVYNPQLASLLSIDMADFGGDPAILEPYFPRMLEEGIAPLCLDLMPKDDLMLSLAGLETYGEIFAIRHDEDSWEAVDLFLENEVTGFYQKLGQWMENGYLFYEYGILSRFGLENTPVDSGAHRYCFLRLSDIDRLSYEYYMNTAEDGLPLATRFFIPKQPAYVYKDINGGVMVVSAGTDHPEECKEFLRLLMLDEELRLLLFSGVEGYHYMWVDDVQIFDQNPGAFNGALELERDLRFWPVEHFSDLYTAQIEAMNADVRTSLSLQHPFDPAGREERYEACKQLFEENMLVFLGYYGAETEDRLNELHEKLIDAGYLELIDAINAGR